MSIIVALKDGNTVVLGADSRFMNEDFSGVESDAAVKVFEVAPGTFLASSGYNVIADAQAVKAADLARKLGTTDIQALGKALAGESQPCFARVIAALHQRRHLHERIEHALTGGLLHGAVLIGAGADGRLGYVFHRYSLQGGMLACKWEEYFGDERMMSYCSAAEVEVTPELCTDPPVLAVQNLLEAQKRASPLIGGPSQIVAIDSRGARWISRVPEAEKAEKLAASTVVFGGDIAMARGNGQAVVTMNNTGIFLFSNCSASGSGVTPGVAGSPSYSATGLTSSPYVGIQAAQIGVFSSSTGPSVTITGSGVNLWSVNGSTGSPYANLTSSAFAIHNGLFVLDITASQIKLSYNTSAVTATLNTSSLSFVNGNYSATIGASSIVLSVVGGPSATLNAGGVSFVSGNYAVSIGSSQIQLLYSGGGVSATLNASGLTFSNGTSSVAITSSAVTITNGSLSATSGNTTVEINVTNNIRVTSTLFGNYAVLEPNGVAIQDAGSSARAALTLTTTGGAGRLVLQNAASQALYVQYGTAGAASAGAATLPANPIGFFSWVLNGVTVKVPYYAN